MLSTHRQAPNVPDALFLIPDLSLRTQVAAATTRLLHDVLMALVQPLGVPAVTPAAALTTCGDGAMEPPAEDWEGMWAALPRPCQENLCELLRVTDDALPALEPPAGASEEVCSPQKLTDLISLYTNPVSILRVPIQTVP